MNESTWTTPAKDWRQPWERDRGTIATDITTLSALHKAKDKANIATTFTLSEVMNSTKLPCCCTDWESLEEVRIRLLRTGILVLKKVLAVINLKDLWLGGNLQLEGNLSLNTNCLAKKLGFLKLELVLRYRRVAGEFICAVVLLKMICIELGWIDTSFKAFNFVPECHTVIKRWLQLDDE